MDPQRYETLRRIYEAVVERPADQQAAALDRLCTDHPDLRAEVESLLAMEAQTLEPGHPLADARIDRERRRLDEALDGTTAADTLAPGTVVGRFTVERLLGRGGMGAVYAATQDRPHRTVALKLIRPGYATERMLRRFEIEAELLGRLSHPGIAQVFDAGVAETPHGEQPFFAMELVEGVPLDRHADERRLGTRERLGLIAQIADAVEHAHQKGVIHRDLKPGNILVDASGRPRVLDFGVARATDADIATTTLRTDIGALIGTLAYMSPEQASGDPDALDTRSDVYALGVVAYQLLAGKLPYEIGAKMIHEAVRVIREQDPTSLSTLDRTLRGDVETIVGKALEKEPQRRYQSAADLAEDVRRYLHDEPIGARPPSAMYQLRKFSRRHTALVGGAAAVFIVLVAGILATSWQAVAATRARDEATRARDEAGRERDQAMEARMESSTVTEFLSEMLSSVRPNEGDKDVTVREVLDQAAATIGDRLTDQPRAEARLRATIGSSYHGLGRHADAEAQFLATLRLLDTLPSSDQLRLDAMNGLAIAYYQQRRLDDLESLQRSIIEESAALFGPDHAATLKARLDLAAMALYLLGRHDEARSIAREVLATAQRAPEPDQLLIAQIRVSLSFLVRDPDERIALITLAAEHHASAYGPEHTETLILRFNLAGILAESGRFAEAEPIARETLALRERILGEEHFDTTFSLHQVAHCVAGQGRLEESVPLFQRALAIRERLVGSEHLDTRWTRMRLGGVYRQLGREEAESQLLQVTEGWDSPDEGLYRRVQVYAAQELVKLYEAQGRRDDAAMWSARLETLDPNAAE